ncbi:putative calcium-transporting ATPase 13, plasma membrane-type-like [Capsicum annuum]|nr:putative calcium-transporting ATPase 13, plasma membrane-type-like [Capsicum annuum]
MNLFYSKDCCPDLIGHADVGYLSDLHKARSQIGYVFICGGTTISWRYTKQSSVAASLNHAEIIAIHEASRECVCRVWVATTVAVVNSHADHGQKLKSGIKSLNHSTKRFSSSSSASSGAGADGLRPMSGMLGSDVGGFIGGGKGEDKRRQADESLRQVMYLSCWGQS